MEKRFALIFSYDEEWIAGSYYILNIIHALNTLPEKEKPKICILCKIKADFDYVLKETAYSKLEYLTILEGKYSFWERIINKAFRLLTGANKINKQLPDSFDMIFPYRDEKFFSKIDQRHKVYWIPDFQEDYFPYFFSDDEFVYRKQYQIYVAVMTKKVVFSSESAKKDFHRLYEYSKCKTYVLPFAVTHPDLTKLSIEVIKKKYSIDQEYFISPNQFFIHKNHIILLEAIKILKEEGFEVKVLFSGKETDYRQPEYFENLKSFVKEHYLENQVRFLGFIPREDQLMLMKYSIAIIQPSLFEGWSTVIEDAKALNKFIIASDLPVHHEQLKQNVTFFNPKDKEDLMKKMLLVMQQLPDFTVCNYKQNIDNFARSFMQIADQ
jgi:glycosyltransferase involved in cell wall biosynthesis